MKCVYHMRPYEAVPGTTDQIHRKWAKICKDFVSKDILPAQIQKLCRDIIHDFDSIEILDIKTPRQELSRNTCEISAGSQ